MYCAVPRPSGAWYGAVAADTPNYGAASSCGGHAVSRGFPFSMAPPVWYFSGISCIENTTMCCVFSMTQGHDERYQDIGGSRGGEEDGG